MPECVPAVINCLNDSNAKVQSAASEASPRDETASGASDELLLR